MTELHTMSQASYLIRVRSGRHAGAELSLSPGTYLLGAGTDADIVLTDDGIAPGHVELRLGDGVCRFWSLDGAVDLAGRQLAPGSRGEASLPADIRVGGVDLTLVAPVAARAKRSGGGLRRLVVPLVAVGVVAGAGAVVASGAVPALAPSSLVSQVVGADQPAIDGSGADGTAPRSPAAVMPQATVPAAARAAPEAGSGAAVDAARTLAARLAEGGMTGLVSVRASGTVVEASGALLPERKDAWLRHQMWFDETYRGRFLLVDRVRTEPGAAAPQLVIQAIWAGAGAYVIGGDGEKYGLGATLPGGWRVEDIARAQVVVTKAGERVALVP